jgi:hypothetical protein
VSRSRCQPHRKRESRRHLETRIKSGRKRSKPLSIGHGHIPQIAGRSTFDSPPDRYSGKTSRFTSRHSFIAFSVQEWRKKDVSRYESKTLRRSKSTMGKAKTYCCRQIGAKERRNHPCWTEDAFATHESSVGSKKKSSREKIRHDLTSSLNSGNELHSLVVQSQRNHRQDRARLARLPDLASRAAIRAS